jgi:uncharacterized SAM-binding protein YcdF (DUF218 family)
LVSAWELTNATASLLLPPGGLIVVGLVGLAFARVHVRTGIGIAAFSFLALYALGTPLCSKSLLRTLEDPYTDPVKDRGAGAIVVLGGGSYANAPEYGGDTVSKETLERLRYAALLHRRTGKPIMVSGGNPMRIHTSEGEQMRAALHDFGVATKWVEGSSNNTLESARMAQRTLNQEGIDSVYIVTHAWHMPRAKMAFQHAGFRVVQAPLGYSTMPAFAMLSLVPNGGGMRDSYMFFHEIVGIAWYRLKFARER